MQKQNHPSSKKGRFSFKKPTVAPPPKEFASVTKAHQFKTKGNETSRVPQILKKNMFEKHSRKIKIIFDIPGMQIVEKKTKRKAQKI